MKSTAIAQESPGSAIDRLAREQGRRKIWLAERLGITPSHLSRMISGERVITRDMAGKLAELFDEPVETFIVSDAA